MRLSSLIVIVLAAVVTSVSAQEKAQLPVDVAKLIKALASENPEPTKRSGPDLVYPPGYDQKKQATVNRARLELKSLGPVAFEALIDNWDDPRYCLTYTVGISGYMENATVGETCRTIIYDQIQPYGFWPVTDDEPRGNPKRPSYPMAFLGNDDEAKNWLNVHQGKTLYEIQVIAVDWVIQKEQEQPAAFTEGERKYMKELRKELLESKKPMTRGNYYLHDYE